MNKVILMGRLTRPPEVRYSQGESQTAIARFSLAVDRRWKREGEPDADFFNCTAFGRLADFAEKYLNQGTKVIVVGRIQNDNYTNREGQKVYSVQVLLDEIEFAESKSASASSVGTAAPQTGGRSAPEQASSDGFMSIPDEEELPFN
ncbi:MAG: single-stranded DNA-binding protein [Bacteroides sp.]|nr:single-stranded DNA-binding protein [Bacteroides sp.]MCM1549654.1 single-stranded DNA-binding protein [Clostridium sp.]